MSNMRIHGPTAVAAAATGLLESFIIYKSGSTFYAKNTVTGVVTSNASANTLIQSVLDAATEGQVIGVRSATYTGLELTIATDGIRLIGEGWSHADSQENPSGVVFKGKDDGSSIITIYNVNRIFNTHVQNIAFDGTLYSNNIGITANTTWLTYVENCYFYKMKAGAIYGYNVFGLQVKDCEFIRCGSSIAHADSADVYTINITGTQSLNNTTVYIRDNTWEIPYYGAIQVAFMGDDSMWIDHNYFEGYLEESISVPTGPMIKVIGGDGATTGLGAGGVISNNFFYYGGSDFIVVDGFDGGHIIDNHICGISISGSCGIVQGGDEFNSAIIRGNRIFTTDCGIVLNAGVDRTTVAGNHIRFCLDTGIVGKFTDSSIEGNIIKSVGTAPHIYSGEGILLTNSTENVIIGNRVDDAAARGIREAGTSDYNIIANNNLRGNAFSGIIIIGANDINQHNM